MNFLLGTTDSEGTNRGDLTPPREDVQGYRIVYSKAGMTVNALYISPHREIILKIIFIFIHIISPANKTS